MVSRPAATISSPRRATHSLYQLRDGDVLRQVDILDRVEELDALLEWTLERLASCDESHAARALVDDGGRDGVAQIVVARRATAVDETDAAHVAVRDLVAR